ncbi:Octanoate-[acyl-carrier-protein]-protein-N-octanoyltransferase [hydrothermal vent metagenome]|uniref:lipoyl(octanoyl) transferase n=1 Tax=hydrothermal vent metagenome TaxID=652676 RepID=A0A3B0ZXA5_9ZZZZ
MQAQDTTCTSDLLSRDFGLCEYQSTWDKMRDYTLTRSENSIDQIWYLQHSPVYTLGLNGKRKHVLQTNHIPLIPTDRGGQVTYHGPGQLIAYLLIDMPRKKIGIKHIVNAIEQAVIDYLKSLNIHSERLAGAPGIYVEDAKIAALGLRVRNGCTYHGLALNVDMDLLPFNSINPCGYEGMQVTQIKDLIASPPDMDAVKTGLHRHLCQHLGYNSNVK